MERTVLIASDGMILTNGEIYGTKIYLADGITPEVFREISRDEYEKMKEQEVQADGGTETEN